MNHIETIITVKLPLKRIAPPKRNQFYSCLPKRERWFGWLFSYGGGSVEDCSGRTNATRHFFLFRWHVLTVHRNEWHDRSDKERADGYLSKWSECEKELRGLRLILMGDSLNADVKKVIRESLGVDFDEGTVK